MNKNKIITDCHRIAKANSPFDSGNLRHNAIKITKRSSKGFTINYSYVNAYYIEYVEEGTKYQEAQGFIDNTAIQVANYLRAVGMGHWHRQNNMVQNAKGVIRRDLYRSSPDYRKIVHERSYEMINKRYNEEVV